jgi:hypothetical protein
MVRLNSAVSRESNLLSVGYAHEGADVFLSFSSTGRNKPLIFAPRPTKRAVQRSPIPILRLRPCRSQLAVVQHTLETHAPRRKNLSRP